ncbi:MAG: redoxin domain-containing protein [Pyrinomonadaceae bacterium]
MKKFLTINFLFVMLTVACVTDPSTSQGKYPPRTTPVQVGEMAPDFTLDNHQQQKVSLSSAKEQAPVLLVFYRGNW